MLPAGMNGVDAQPSDPARRAVGSRGIAVLGALVVLGSLLAALLAGRGSLGAAAVPAAAAGAAMLLATAPGRPGGWPSRWTGFAITSIGRVPEAAVMSGIAWHFRVDDRRLASVAVAGIAITFLAAYARTRGVALGWPSRTPSAQPLRYGAAFAALAVPGGAEAACWILVALTSIEFVRVAAEMWRHAEGT